MRGGGLGGGRVCWGKKMVLCCSARFAEKLLKKSYLRRAQVGAKPRAGGRGALYFFQLQ